MGHYDECRDGYCPGCGQNARIECECKKKNAKIKKLKEDAINTGMGVEKLDGEEELSDMQALRCIMAAIIYGGIRHEKYLSRSLIDTNPETLYASTFDVVDGLLEESKK